MMKRGYDDFAVAGTGHSLLIWALASMSLGTAIATCESLLSQNLALLRYAAYAVATACLIAGAAMAGSLRKSKGLVYRGLLFAMFVGVVHSLAVAAPGIFAGSGDYYNLKLLLSGQLLIALLPVMLIVKPNLGLWRRAIQICYWLALAYLGVTIPLLIYFTEDRRHGAETMANAFAYGAAVIVLTLPYHSFRVQVVGITTLLLALAVTLVLGRRSQVLYIGSVFLFFAIILMATSIRSMVQKKALNAGLAVFVVLIISTVGYSLWQPDTSYFSERIEENRVHGIFYSRESVIKDMLQDFDGNVYDWLLGRGINGSYLSDRAITADDMGRGVRDVIENGYLQLILKDGLIYLVPFMIISIIAGIRGLFNSVNLLSKAAAAMVMTNLVNMVGFGLPNATMAYAFIWLSIPICLSPSVRNLSDDAVAKIVGLGRARRKETAANQVGGRLGARRAGLL